MNPPALAQRQATRTAARVFTGADGGMGASGRTSFRMAIARRSTRTGIASFEGYSAPSNRPHANGWQLESLQFRISRPPSRLIGKNDGRLIEDYRGVEGRRAWRRAPAV